MYRGTTPTLELELDTTIDFGNITDFFVTLAGQVKSITLDMDRCSFDNEKKIVSVTLTQEETLSLNPGCIDVQVRFKVKSKQAYATSIAKVDISRILKDGVI